LKKEPLVSEIITHAIGVPGDDTSQMIIVFHTKIIKLVTGADESKFIRFTYDIPNESYLSVKDIMYSIKELKELKLLYCYENDTITKGYFDTDTSGMVPLPGEKLVVELYNKSAFDTFEAARIFALDDSQRQLNYASILIKSKNEVLERIEGLTEKDVILRKDLIV
jgi:hypothetical protein